MAMAGEKVKTEGACDTIDAESQELHETAWGWVGMLRCVLALVLMKV